MIRILKNVDNSNDRAQQLNQIEKLVVDKPVVIKEKKKPVEKIIEAPKELIRSSRSNKGQRITTRFDDEYPYERKTQNLKKNAKGVGQSTDSLFLANPSCPTILFLSQ